MARRSKAGKVYRLGVLTPGVRPASQVMSNLLPLSLRELGYVEGQNLVIEQRFAEGKLDRLAGLARELVLRRVDLLVAVSPAEVRAAKDTTTTIPIVMILSYSDPVELGFVASFARPGGNITVVAVPSQATRHQHPEMNSERVHRGCAEGVAHPVRPPAPCQPIWRID